MDEAWRVLRLSAEDNVGVASQTLSAGTELVLGDKKVTLRQTIPTGHKIALVRIPKGQKVFKYGAPIGTATEDIEVGDYVHTHNVASDYLPTYTLDGLRPFST